MVKAGLISPFLNTHTGGPQEIQDLQQSWFPYILGLVLNFPNYS